MSRSYEAMMSEVEADWLETVRKAYVLGVLDDPDRDGFVECPACGEGLHMSERKITAPDGTTVFRVIVQCDNCGTGAFETNGET